jgi:branched-chain amino acid transport system substrate-binding protein
MKKIILLLLLTTVLSCSDNTTEYMADNVIKIGALMPLSGSGSSTGESMLEALKIAVNKINASNSKYKAQLFDEDTKTNPQTALEKLKNFKALGIKIVIGPYSSSELTFIKEYADSNDIVLISPSSVAMSLAIENDNIFRFSPNDNQQVKAISKYFDYIGVNKVNALCRADVWGQGLIDSVEKYSALKVQFVQKVSYATDLQDFNTTVSLISKNVDDLIKSNHEANTIGCYLACFNEGTNILNEAAKYPSLSDVKWFGTSAYALNSTLITNRIAAEFAIKTDFVCPVYGLDDDVKTSWEPIFNQLKSTLKRDPESYALVAYDAFNIAFNASLLLKNTDNLKDILDLKSAVIYLTKEFSGITGKLDLDSFGDRLNGNYVFWKIKKNGLKYEWYKTAVYHTNTDILDIIN